MICGESSVIICGSLANSLIQDYLISFTTRINPFGGLAHFEIGSLRGLVLLGFNCALAVG
jgi:hypothetical protein